MHRIARLIDEACYRQLGLTLLAIFEDVNRTAVFATR